jgi:mono/diheme cytochrome c family protein
MKRLKKILVVFFLLLVVVVGGGAIYLKAFLPNVGAAPDLKVEITPERVERGKYLANHVCVCMDCHGTRDWTKFSGPPVEGSLGKGGELFDQKFGFPGAYYSRNITPFNLGKWSDGEIFRAITCGVNKDGKALFPVMPYNYYGQMDPDDIYCIIAYLRSLPSISNTPPESKSDFPMNFIINTIPSKGNPGKRPDPSDKIAYGKYIAMSAGCIECHTQVDDKGQKLAGKEFGGGREFPFPDGSKVRSANITPDKETGIGATSQETFVNLFHARSDSTTRHTTLAPGTFNTIMPWTMYGSMKDEDLAAIYAYLQTLPPMKNEVEKYTPAK